MGNVRRFSVYREHTTEHHGPDRQNPPDEIQYEGVVFTDGTCVLRWCTPIRSTSIWDSFEAAMKVHGHPEYGTKVVFHDAPMYLPWEDSAEFRARVNEWVTDGRIE